MADVLLSIQPEVLGVVIFFAVSRDFFPEAVRAAKRTNRSLSFRVEELEVIKKLHGLEVAQGTWMLSLKPPRICIVVAQFRKIWSFHILADQIQASPVPGFKDL